MLRILVLVAFLFTPCISHGAFFNSDSNKQLKSLLRTDGTDINAGIYIMDLNTGSSFSYHGRRMFSPASVAKLFTTYGALTYLGSDYKFQTVIAVSEPVKNKRLKGDVYIRFSGDPSFTYSDLKDMVNKLDLESLDGNVVIDGTIFDENHSAPGGFTWDDNPFYYAAPKSAIIVNKNCSEAKMMPSTELDNKAKLIIEDPTILKIANNVLTVAPSKEECPYKSRYMGQNQYEVYGCMFQNMKDSVRLNFALQDNKLMIESYIKKVFDELNIKWVGHMQFKKTPGQGLDIIFVHESAPLRELLKEALSHSCNTHASALFKHTTAKYIGDTASDEMGEKVFKKLLKKAGLKGKFVIKDGAGESRYNLVTPETVGSLLDLIYKNKNVREIFLQNLALYGSRGTLITRSISPQYDKYVYAKTGYDSRTSAIAGYYLPQNGHAYAFALMINNHDMPWDQVKALEDKILLHVLKVLQ